MNSYENYMQDRISLTNETLKANGIEFDIETPGYGMWSLTAIECLAVHGYTFSDNTLLYENFTKDEWIPLAEEFSGMNLYDYMDKVDK